MASHGTILLVSGSPGLNEVLGTLATTYSLSLVTAGSAKAGLAAFKQAEPDCVIFDARVLRDHNLVERVKEKIESKDVPVLFLNTGGGAFSRASGLHSSFSLEPVIKFVTAQSERLKSRRPSGFWRRLVGGQEANALQHGVSPTNGSSTAKARA